MKRIIALTLTGLLICGAAIAQAEEYCTHEMDKNPVLHDLQPTHSFRR